ncbi:MAG: MerR family transcriptional regulator [Nitrospiraceae bacterium]|nr:MAG: MerR family transcriptional regulator [Nitrospiraceae bacterium]
MQLTLQQVARLFHVSENTVTQWIQEENLPVHEIRSCYRFDRAELLEWAVATRRSFSPEIFQETNGDHVAEVSLAEAIERGGVARCTEGNDRCSVFRDAIGRLPFPETFDRDNLLELLMAREKLGGTAVGNGIAIPHPRYPIVLPGSESVVQVCFLKEPIDFRAGDGVPVDTLFLMICPTVHVHLQLLARLACVLQSETFRGQLRSRPDKAQLVAAVRKAEESFAASQKMEQS